MSRSVRTTIVFAVISGILWLPVIELLQLHWTWPVAFKLTLWIELVVYSILLIRWSKTSPVALMIPLAIVLGAALWPQTQWGFFSLALAVFCWIRSGVCFNTSPLRALLAEGVTALGGILLLLSFGGQGPVVLALKLCLFVLVQSLYFYIVPCRAISTERIVGKDAFEAAADGIRRVINGLG